MVIFEKILIVLVACALAVGILKYTEPIVRTFGKMGWAEQKLGMGGTYTIWKLIAVALIVGSLIFVTSVHW